MIRQRSSERAVLFGYFIVLILLGTGMLYLPISWGGSGRLQLLDAFFTSVSAVCVTGLITVDTAQYSLFGKWIILFLIQFGGLGILTFTTIFFISGSGRKVSLRESGALRKYFLESVEFHAGHILRNILLMTLIVEASGTLILYALTYQDTVSRLSLFSSLFHAISAFCNAGFSLFSDSLYGYSDNPAVLAVVMILIAVGGLGFLVLNDVKQVLFRKKKRLTLHSVLVLSVTAFLITLGAVLFFFLERRAAFSGMRPAQQAYNALFQSVTARTAGFNTVDQGELTATSQLSTMILMFIGGSPASIAGGIKTTTFAILLMALVKEISWQGRISIRKRALSQKTVTRSLLLLSKAAAILFISLFLLTLTEMREQPSGTGEFLALAFESFSAFGTVGLSAGTTASLSSAGKFIIILTMFAGRVGIISLSIPLLKERYEEVEYPEEEVLIG